MAVHTLLEWYRSGTDVATRMPALSTWLGHGDPASTFWYLHASPELLALAAGMLHDSTGRALVSYSEIRERLCPHPETRSLFVTTRGTRPVHPTIHQPFRALLDQAGISHPSPPRNVRIHDLRH